MILKKELLLPPLKVTQWQPSKVGSLWYLGYSLSKIEAWENEQQQTVKGTLDYLEKVIKRLFCEKSLKRDEEKSLMKCWFDRIPKKASDRMYKGTIYIHELLCLVFIHLLHQGFKGFGGEGWLVMSHFIKWEEMRKKK